jgi:hypothetical protein
VHNLYAIGNWSAALAAAQPPGPEQLMLASSNPSCDSPPPKSITPCETRRLAFTSSNSFDLFNSFNSFNPFHSFHSVLDNPLN